MYVSENQNIIVGERLKKIRSDLGYTQTEMAKLVGIGQVGYSDLERGKNQLSFKTIQLLSQKLSIDLNWLINGEEDVHISPLTDNEPDFKTYSKQILSPVPANAGIPFEYSQEWLDKEQHVLIPGISGRLVVFIIDGVSMMPGVEPGCYLGCRKVERKHDLSIGHIYIMVARTGIWLKRLTGLNDIVNLESDNPDYPSFTVPFEDVRELYLPIVKITPYDSSNKSGTFMSSYVDYMKLKL